MSRSLILGAALTVVAVTLVASLVHARDGRHLADGGGARNEEQVVQLAPRHGLDQLVPLSRLGSIASCGPDYNRWQRLRTDFAYRQYLACKGW